MGSSNRRVNGVDDYHIAFGKKVSGSAPQSRKGSGKENERKGSGKENERKGSGKEDGRRGGGDKKDDTPLVRGTRTHHNRSKSDSGM